MSERVIPGIIFNATQMEEILKYVTIGICSAVSTQVPVLIFTNNSCFREFLIYFFVTRTLIKRCCIKMVVFVFL